LRILLADDHQPVRRVVKRILESEGWFVCGEASNGREAVEMAVRLAPDAAVIDVSMPELNGLEATRKILQIMPQMPIVILTLHNMEDLAEAAIRSGARACIVKTDLSRLVREMQILFQSNFRPPEITEVVPHNEDDLEALLARLDSREREVLELILQSKTSKEIARALALDVEVVQTCKEAILEKTEMDSMFSCIRYALRRPSRACKKQ
jgi:DNA-binding NarL/FixJ family response regulator